MYDRLPSFVRSPDPAVFLGDGYLVLDFETTNREHGSALDAANSLLLACWRVGPSHPSFGSGRDRSHWDDEFHQDRLVSDIAHADFIVAHHAKFELGWLKRCGVDLRKVLPYCTMIGEKVLAGNRKRFLGLEATAQRRGLGGKVSWVAALIKAGVCPSVIPRGPLEAYCRQDVALTERVLLLQRTELHRDGLLPVHYCRNLVTPVLADVEFNGMMLDRDRVREVYDDYASRYADLDGEFGKLTGGLNVKSPQQLAAHIYGEPVELTAEEIAAGKKPALGFAEVEDYKGRVVRTAPSKKAPGGNKKTDKETVAKLKAKTPAQKAFIKVAKELIKLKTSLQNLTKMQAICDASPESPIVYATFNQTVTDTDRLSSTGRRGGFQFHNFDRAFKRLFRARKAGGRLCEGDAPQLEFRGATYLGNDAIAKQDILSGLDVHAVSASTIGVGRQ